jgi:hypothetical protein
MRSSLILQDVSMEMPGLSVFFQDQIRYLKNAISHFAQSPRIFGLINGDDMTFIFLLHSLAVLRISLPQLEIDRQI